MKIVFTILMMFFISNCSEDNIAGTSNTEQAADNKRVSSDSALLNTQMDALNKANQVENSLQKAVEARDDDMRQQGI